jgi:cytochrome P450
MIRQDFDHTKEQKDVPDMFSVALGPNIVLWIASPDLLNDLYLSRNRYFDKHMDIKRLAEPLMGNSLLFIENNEMWNMHRKAMSASLYKDKLIKYTDIIN